MCINTVDPITQEEVQTIRRPFYVYLGPSRAFITLDAIPTSEYILATGDIRNPITQEDFNIVELHRLDKLTAGLCAGVVNNLSAVRQRACRDFERAQLCQAMETEPATLWSYAMQAPYSVTPQLVVFELGTILTDYAVAVAEYATVDRAAALQFHSDNLSNFLSLDITCGDVVVFESVLEILAHPSVDRLMPSTTDGDDDDTQGSQESSSDTEFESSESGSSGDDAAAEEDDEEGPSIKRTRVE